MFIRIILILQDSFDHKNLVDVEDIYYFNTDDIYYFNTFVPTRLTEINSGDGQDTVTQLQNKCPKVLFQADVTKI